MTASGKIQKYKLREVAVERYGLQSVGADTAQRASESVDLNENSSCGF
jgi:hypothetical protein